MLSNAVIYDKFLSVLDIRAIFDGSPKWHDLFLSVFATMPKFNLKWSNIYPVRNNKRTFVDRFKFHHNRGKHIALIHQLHEMRFQQLRSH